MLPPYCNLQKNKKIRTHRWGRTREREAAGRGGWRARGVSPASLLTRSVCSFRTVPPKDCLQGEKPPSPISSCWLLVKVVRPRFRGSRTSLDVHIRPFCSTTGVLADSIHVCKQKYYNNGVNGGNAGRSFWNQGIAEPCIMHACTHAHTSKKSKSTKSSATKAVALVSTCQAGGTTHGRRRTTNEGDTVRCA